MSELVIGWPNPSQVMFALEMNTIHPIHKNKEEQRSTWYSNAERDQFKKNARIVVSFFRKLENAKQEVDQSQYDRHACAWGLENSIYGKTAAENYKLMKYVCKSVLSMQEIQIQNDKLDQDLIASVSRDASKSVQERAHEIGLSCEDEVYKTNNDFE